MSESLGKKLRIYFTSDTHGFLLPVDYTTGRPIKTGLLGCAASFEKDGGTVIIDGGDTLQGSPLAAYAAHHLESPALIASAFNQGKFDFITLGNHDFNHGTSYLIKYLENLDARCICANVRGRLPVIPWTVHRLENGLRIGITGVITDYTNFWEEPANLENVEIGEPFAAAKEALASMKDEADVTVCIYHGGFERDIRTGELLSDTTENIGWRICEELDFDLVLTGHQHMPIEGANIRGTYAVQPRAAAVHSVLVEGTFTSEGISFSSKFIEPVQPVNIPKELTEADAKVQERLEKPVGFFTHPLVPRDKLDMALHGTELADFFNKIQLEETGAQAACCSLANEIKGFGTSVSMRDILATYVYSDTVITLEVSGAILKEALERTVSYFDLDKDGKPVVSRRFTALKKEHYNFDFFAHINYTADLRKPPGERIIEIFLGGNKLNPDDKFTMTTTKYRAKGGGGYEMYLKCKVLAESREDASGLVARYLERHGEVEVTRFPAQKYLY